MSETEYSAEQVDPKQFSKFSRMDLGDGVSFVLGWKDGYSQVQSVRFQKGKWTEGEAHAWLQRHNMPVEMIKGKDKPTKFITLGEGDSRKVVPVIDGKIGGGAPPPLEVMRKIAAGTRDPKKKAAWEKRIKGGTEMRETDTREEKEENAQVNIGDFSVKFMPQENRWRLWCGKIPLQLAGPKDNVIKEARRRQAIREATAAEVKKGGPLPDYSAVAKEMRTLRRIAFNLASNRGVDMPRFTVTPYGRLLYEQGGRERFLKVLKKSIRKENQYVRKYGDRARKATAEMIRLGRAGIWHLSQGTVESNLETLAPLVEEELSVNVEAEKRLRRMEERWSKAYSKIGEGI